MRHDLAGAERAYREVLATDTVTRHRIQAAVTLANLAWRVRGDTAAANQWLRRAPSPGGGFAALRERALMRLANGDAAGARAAGDSALAAAMTDAEREEAAAVYGRSAIEPALTARLAGEPLTTAARDAVGDAMTRLRSTVEQAPGALEPARLLLVGAILTEQGAPALAGWRSYYLVAAGDSSSGLLAAPRRVLESLLPRLTPGNGSDDERLTLIRALSDSRVFEAAAALARTPAAGGRIPADLDAGAREIVAYARFLEDVERATDEFYRATLLGAPRPAEWRSGLIHRGALRVLLFTFEPGGRLPEHQAPGQILIHCLRGELMVSAGGGNHRISAGEAVAIDPDVSHSVEALAESEMLLTVCKVDP